MSTNAGKQRKNRQTPNRRTRQFDKSLMNEGVYSNPRFIHSTLVLVGCNVQVTVKNGGIYEGIFKTVSPSSQIVLEMAHKVDTSSGSSQNSIPTKQMLINSIIFNLSDVVTIAASNVDMDFANKDNFTDSAITKFNNGGGSSEKELQPWDADGGLESPLESLEKTSTNISSSANGWAAEDMFNINAEKFEVKSSYDPNLTQYTTPLVKQDTKEYREREARAARLANEIEGSEGYRDRIALENGDGDDEEMAFSAVVRPGEANNNSSAGGKYVPPHMRSRVPSQNRPQRISSGNQSPHAQSPSPQQPSPSRSVSGPTLTHTTQQRPNHQVAAAPVVVSVSSAEQPSEETSDNMNKEDGRPSETQDRGKSSERTITGHPAQPNTTENRRTHVKARDKLQDLYDFKSNFQLSEKKVKENPERKLSQTSPVTSQAPSVPSAQPSGQLSQSPASTEQIPGNLQQQQAPAQPSQQPAQQQPQLGGSPQVQSSSDKPAPTTAIASAAVTTDKKDDDKKDADVDDKDKKSSLNPLAKEFVPGKFNITRPTQPLQISTPPRAATQSPVIVPVPAAPSLYHQYHIVQNAAHPPNPMMQNSQSQRITHNKRVVVSAQTRPDLTAAAATGQPLLQTPLASQNPQYPTVHQFNVPPATMMANAAAQGALPQVFQPQGIVPMGPANARMVNPQLVQGPTTPTDQVSFQQNQQHVYVSPQGAHSLTNVPSYMSGPPPNAGAAGSNQQPPPSHSIPTHMAPHHHATPPHSQTNHMSSQGGASGGHPTPSPVPQPGSASHQHPQQGHPPPSSGTPQPPVMYHGVQGNHQQAGHPPLQPSPHTPTSPQTMYPQGVTFSVPYPVSQSYSVQQHLTYSTTNPQPTTVTHAPHHHHAHLPQVVMMPAQPHQNNPHPTAHNPGINPQIPHNHAVAAAATGTTQQHSQYQMNHTAQHPQGHPVQGGPLHGQAGPGLPLSVPTLVQHPQKVVSQAPQPYHQ